jgi:hypothetical protein
MNNTFSIFKRSITLVVLFCFVAISQAFGMICVSDTIIIDGKTVVVERVVDYEKPDVDVPKPEPKEKPERRHTGYVGFGVGPSFLLVNSEVPNSDYQSLNEFVDSEGKFRVGFRLNGVYGRKWKKLGIEISPSLDIDSYKNHYFAESSLDDSLYLFESTDAGVLNQITRHDLGIGVEFYDIEATLIKSTILMVNLHVPINVVYHHKIDRTNHLEFRLGLGPYLNVSKQGGPKVLMNEGGEFEYVSTDVLSSRISIQGLIGADWSFKTNHRVDAYANIGVWVSPSFTPQFEDNLLYNQTVSRFGARVSINFFSEKNRNKVAQ